MTENEIMQRVEKVLMVLMGDMSRNIAEKFNIDATEVTQVMIDTLNGINNAKQETIQK